MTPRTRSSASCSRRPGTQGLWAPHLPPEAGGSGSGFLEYADLNEEIGRSFIAQLIFGCQAPDAGNGEILHLFGTDEQKERFLRPLVAGEVRSFFGMTEPEVAGSDPTLLRGRAERDGDEWVIDAHKWFSSGADGAAFGVVMVVTEPDAEPHRRASMILVPTDTPGYELVRRIPVMGHEGRGWGTHCETRFTGVRVPLGNMLGEPRRRVPDRAEAARTGTDPPRHALARADAARVRADVRAGARARGVRRPARRQADRAELDRRVGGRHPGVPADDAAGGAPDLDAGDEARVEISLVKFFAARVLGEVIDRAIQVHGGLGLTDDTPLALMWRMARGGRVYDGPDEVHKAVVARRILRSFAEGDGWRFT